jgi:energy-coupling factor transporter transmembrane protein EcfT
MTIIDIMLRELEEAQRKEAQEMAARLYDKNVRRRLWRRRAKVAAKIAVALGICAILFAVMRYYR